MSTEHEIKLFAPNLTHPEGHLMSQNLFQRGPTRGLGVQCPGWALRKRSKWKLKDLANVLQCVYDQTMSVCTQVGGVQPGRSGLVPQEIPQNDQEKSVKL